MPFLNRQFILVMAVALLAFACYYPFSPMRRQQVGIQQASALGARIQKRIDQEPAIGTARTVVMTVPCLPIVSEDTTEANARRLVQITQEEYGKVDHVPEVVFLFRIDGKPYEHDPLPGK